MSNRISSWQLSFLIHGFIALAGIVMVVLPNKPVEYLNVPIYVADAPENTQVLKPENKTAVVLKSVNTPLPSVKSQPTRAIFGTSRNSLTSSQGVVEGKLGNTLAKEVDTTVLKSDDADALPTPTDEFLVSQMPVVISEVRPIYPKEARDARTEGAVVIDALIDTKGKVRKVSVIEGAEVFRNSALAAMVQFIFQPALVDGKPVAVRIRYTLRFKLEI